VQEISLGFTFSSFVAGFLTFLAPCTLPLVPAYLAFISGVDPKDLNDSNKAETTRKKIFYNGIFFIIGFTFIFVLFGTLAGFIGEGLNFWRIWVTRIGGLLIVTLGLLMLGILNIRFLNLTKQFPIPKWLELGKPWASLLVGGTFAFGWTPCVGPILGSILLLASAYGSPYQGAFLLFIFSLGLSLPFLFIATTYSKASKYIEHFNKYLIAISKVGGVLLIILGVLLMTDNFGLVISKSYELLDFIDYDRLLDFL
jgi:cytochrome c-type biogenesis protein